MKVLIVIDMQECFLNEKETDLPEKIRKHIEESDYDRVIFSQLINDESSQFYERLDWEECMNDGDVRIVSELEDLASENTVVQKKTYSVFKSEEFKAKLNLEKSDKIYLCGVDYDACVLATAFEALDRNLDFQIIRNLTESTSENNRELVRGTDRIVERSLSSN